MGRSRAHNLRRKARQQIDRLFSIDQGKCHWCSCDLSLDFYQQETPYATVDHVYPIALGGDSNPTNLVVSCAACNHWRSIAWQSYGLLLYASHQDIQRQLIGKKKITGDRLACRASKRLSSKYKATIAMQKKILEQNIPQSIAAQFKVYRCKWCSFWHWRKFTTGNLTRV